MSARSYLVGAALVLLLSPTATLTSAPAGVQLEMKNGRLHVDSGIVLDVTRLRGVMVSRKEGAPPVFDDQRSYVLHLNSGEMSMDMSSLQNLMNQHVFNYQGAPLKDVTVEPDGQRLKLK